MDRRFKTINNPSARKLSWSLIGIPIIAVFFIVFHLAIEWVWIVGGFSALLYLGLMTYYCLRQKCYMHLLYSWKVVIFAVIFLYMQHSMRIPQ